MTPFAQATFFIIAATLCAYGTNTASAKRVTREYKKVHKQMTKLADAGLFAGMAYAVKGGRTVFSQSYGEMIPEWGIPFPKDPRHVRYHIGSVMQLMFATATWQQHAWGKLDIYQTIDKYLTPADLNLTKWCPRLWNDTTHDYQSDDCHYPRIVDLLAHRSGFIDTGVHCRFDPGSWQSDWCYAGRNGTDFPLKVASLFALGALSPLGFLIAVEHSKVPLQNLPDTVFEDMTIDDVYVAAILEKRTGMPMKAIFEENIFNRAGLTDSFYDVSARNDGLYRNYLPLPGYNAYVSPLSLSMYGMDFPYIGNLTVTSGDMTGSSKDPEGRPYGTLRKLARNTLGIDSAWIGIASTAGALVSSFRDQARWMTTLTRHSNRLGINNTVVRSILTTGGPDKGFLFAQGTVTYPIGSAAKTPLGANWTFYIGNLGYSASQYTEWPNSDDPSEDVYVALVIYTKPMLDAFSIFTVNSAVNSTGGDAGDPLNPNNGVTTCRMSVKDFSDPVNAADFSPHNGASGGLANRDPQAWSYFWSRHQAAGTPISKGPVDVPHVYCDAFYKPKGFPGLEGLFLGQIAAAALGRPWFPMDAGPVV